MLVLAIVIGLLLLILSFVALHYLRLAQRAKVKKRSFSKEQEQVLRAHPSWSWLSAEHREKWKQHINVFLDEKKIWNSQTKSPLDLKHQTIVAAEACLPLINRKTNYYGQISDIYYDLETQKCSDASDQTIDWPAILYPQYCQEVSRPSLNKEQFTQMSKQFLQGELDSAELEEFYRLSPRSASI